jgi:hypothetical protein
LVLIFLLLWQVRCSMWLCCSIYVAAFMTDKGGMMRRVPQGTEQTVSYSKWFGVYSKRFGV